MRRLLSHAGSGRIAALILLCVWTLFFTACRHRSESGGDVAQRDINAVMETHADTLMATPGVTGVAVGALEDGTPCILVLILEDSEEIKSRIPKTLEGYPVQIMVSGLIEPMQSDSGG
jgi:hypothetical protein